MEDEVERRQARGVETKAWMGDGGGSEEANGVGMCSPMKHICLFNEETPSHASIPRSQNGTMAKDAWLVRKVY